MNELAREATIQSGWIAGVLVLVVLCGCTVLSFIVRQLWVDHRELNTFCRTKMASALEAVGAAMRELCLVLAQHPYPTKDERLKEISDTLRDEVRRGDQ